MYIESYYPITTLEAYDPKKKDVTDFHFGQNEDAWTVLFFYPADFTFVCPTELADLEKHAQEFSALNITLVVVSTDTVYTHKAWIETEKMIEHFSFLMAADHNGKASRELGVYNDVTGMAERATFIFDPKGFVQGIEVVPDGIGRSAKELIRKIKAMQFAATNPGNVCPASWEEGDQVIVKSFEKSGKMYEELSSKTKKGA